MNALDSKWDTQKLEWGNISLALTFLNQTLLSQQYNTMCQGAQLGFRRKIKTLLWPVILLQNVQGRMLCAWKEWVNNPDCPFSPQALVTLELFNRQLPFC
jgi:hypothetical protein